MAYTEKKEYLEMKSKNSYLNRIIKAGNNRRPRYAMPTILRANCQGTKIHKYVPHPDEDECMTRDQSSNFISTNKLILSSHGDWEISVVMVKSQNFDSREDFDEIMLEGSRSSFGGTPPTVYSSISLLDAFRKLHVKISVDTENVLSSATEEQRETYDSYFWKYGKEKTKKRLLNSLLLKLFGSPSTKDTVDYKGYEAGFKELTIYEFRFYYEDGNTSQGTARHGDYFLYFRYDTS